MNCKAKYGMALRINQQPNCKSHYQYCQYLSCCITVFLSYYPSFIYKDKKRKNKKVLEGLYKRYY
jgi:hypothetical protein